MLSMLHCEKVLRQSYMDSHLVAEKSTAGRDPQCEAYALTLRGVNLLDFTESTFNVLT